MALHFSLILPFVIITTILVALMLFTPIGHSGMFLLLLSVHFGMSFSDFTHIKNYGKCRRIALSKVQNVDFLF